MGYDITYHPVSVSDIQYFLFDVLADPSLAETRARELATDEEDYRMIREFYYDELDGKLPEIRENEKKGLPAASCWLARTAAALAGFKYPYWYCRGSALSFMAHEDQSLKGIFTSICDLGRATLGDLVDSSDGLITDNYTASGYIAQPGQIAQHIKRLSEPRVKKRLFGLKSETIPSLFESTFDDEGIEALERAVRYCDQHGLGMIEASDVYCPMAGGGSRYDNLRAAFNKTIDKPN